MTTRRILLGLISAVAMCGAVAAKPPGLQPNPLAEGREMDPVTREFYLPDPTIAATEDSTPSRALDKSAPRSAVWFLLHGIHEAAMNELTIPLGTAEMWNAERDMGN